MEYCEDEFLQLSGIQHFCFCRRQWALIHIENQWQENVRTIEGNIVHERCHDESIIEKRGKKEDASLLNYYNQLLDRGTYWVDSHRMKKVFKKFDMRWKSENIIGLQIADLIAYPVTRHVLNPNGVNLAFDVLKKNIFQLNGKVYGMKIFPKEQGK